MVEKIQYEHVPMTGGMTMIHGETSVILQNSSATP